MARWSSDASGVQFLLALPLLLPLLPAGCSTNNKGPLQHEKHHVDRERPVQHGLYALHLAAVQ